jgi:hypothetical protein
MQLGPSNEEEVRGENEEKRYEIEGSQSATAAIKE